MEEPSRLQSMASRRVGHDWATSLWLFTFMHCKGNDNPLQCSCLEIPRDRRAWWAAIYGSHRVRHNWSDLEAAAAAAAAAATVMKDNQITQLSTKKAANPPSLNTSPWKKWNTQDQQSTLKSHKHYIYHLLTFALFLLLFTHEKAKIQAWIFFWSQDLWKCQMNQFKILHIWFHLIYSSCYRHHLMTLQLHHISPYILLNWNNIKQ